MPDATGRIRVRREGPTREAGVLVPVYRDAHGALRIVVIRRTDHGVHGGQLAFPGGNRDPGDATLRDTALREAEEEIGLGSDRVELIAALPVVDTVTTNYHIAPFLGRIDRPAAWRVDTREVAEVIEPRVADLLAPDAHDETMERFDAWPEPMRIAFYRVGGRRLWGASYRILRPLLPRLAAGEWEV